MDSTASIPLVVLIGASGSGKTTLARAIAGRQDAGIAVFYFDRIGVPTLEQMIEQYGSSEAWQRAKTIDWMATLAAKAKPGARLLFEGQTRFSFLAEGAAAARLAYVPILVDCDDDTRSRRLRLERLQPELANDGMMDWARYLRREARERGHPILDTSSAPLAACVDWVIDRFEG